MLNSIKNELFKSFSQIKLFIFLLVIGGAPLVLSITFKILTQAITEDEIVEAFTFTGLSFPLETLGSMTELLIPIFIVILVGDKITEEYRQGTIKLPLITPISREKLLISKMITIGLEIMVMLMILFGSSYLFGFLFFGTAENLTYGALTLSLSEGILYTISSYAFTGFVLFVFSLVVFLLATLFKSVGSLIAISVGMLLGMQMLGLLGENVAKGLLNTYFKFYITFFHPMEGMDYVLGISIILLYGLLGTLLSLIIFKKKDIMY